MTSITCVACCWSSKRAVCVSPEQMMDAVDIAQMEPGPFRAVPFRSEPLRVLSAARGKLPRTNQRGCATLWFIGCTQSPRDWAHKGGLFAYG